MTRLRSLGPYEGSLRDIVHALKYKRHQSVATRLSRLLRAELNDVLSGAHCSVPVPLHWSRQWARGFNQAAALAEGLGLPVVHALTRTRRTASQSTLSSVGRRANVKDAFSVRRRMAPALQGRIVVLVDDVCTTTATLDACARVLLAAGAREVRAVTAARAVLGRR